ncbi:protein-S-isoprenylcysteine O-methyltransferase [Leptopilina boulardi]|uniref:protein-S-isoprenylcysteine O-methyltransferase n=1 Tax=Leptopilina boulardi TaxID=63433 RepID=UPI0021F65B2F|nr:protein-S-isoprenylcysteine O-methyltransferase [Leptopilina boulardi]
MLIREGKISLFSFIISLIVSILPELLLRLEFDYYQQYIENIWILHALQFILLNFLIILTFRGFSYQVAVRAALLGYIFGIGILIFALAPESWRMFGIYASVLSFFHYSEFMTIAWTNPNAISIDSFILNHSMAYGIAACSSWFEFIVERYYFPSMKVPSSISYFGFIMCFCGEILRKLAIFTAKRNFNHLVQTEKTVDHELITHGVYRMFRHPSYVGWFYWSIGTQLILQNPFCFLSYVMASWKFFNDRVKIEEIMLLNFFGEEYIEYQNEVGTGLPFISGYKIDL